MSTSLHPWGQISSLGDPIKVPWISRTLPELLEAQSQIQVCEPRTSGFCSDFPALAPRLWQHLPAGDIIKPLCEPLLSLLGSPGLISTGPESPGFAAFPGEIQFCPCTLSAQGCSSAMISLCHHHKDKGSQVWMVLLVSLMTFGMNLGIHSGCELGLPGNCEGSKEPLQILAVPDPPS